MAETVSAVLSPGITLTASFPVLGSNPRKITSLDTPTDTFGTAVGANTVAYGCDAVYGPIVLSIAFGATTTLTLTGAAITDNLGNTITAARGKFLYIHPLGTGETASDGTAGNAAGPCLVGGTFLAGAARPIKTSDAAALLQIPSGGVLLWSFDNAGAGYTVTGSSTDTITIKNNDGALTMKVVVGIGLPTS